LGIAARHFADPNQPITNMALVKIYYLDVALGVTAHEKYQGASVGIAILARQHRLMMTERL